MICPSGKDMSPRAVSSTMFRGFEVSNDRRSEVRLLKAYLFMRLTPAQESMRARMGCCGPMRTATFVNVISTLTTGSVSSGVRRGIL